MHDKHVSKELVPFNISAGVSINLHEQAHRLRAEFCVVVSGVVEIRPEGNANAEIATGDIEVNATALTVLGESAPLPFQLDESAGEEARLKYRYLDMRREGGPGDAIRLRSRVNAAALAELRQPL